MSEGSKILVAKNSPYCRKKNEKKTKDKPLVGKRSLLLILGVPKCCKYYLGKIFTFLNNMKKSSTERWHFAQNKTRSGL